MDEEKTPGIEILGDSPTTKDELGFGDYVDILQDSIEGFDGESPLTIGIHGKWGSGKTSLMKMLKARFDHPMFDYPIRLFSWDNVPEKVNKELIKSFGQDLNIGWADGVEIRKSDDGKTISIVKDEKSAEITIDEENKKATLKISNVRTHDDYLKVRKKKGKVNIHANISIRSCLMRLLKARLGHTGYLFSWDNVPEKVNGELLRFLRDDLNIGWADGAEISKSGDDKTISISRDEESAEITIDEENKKATLKINNVRTHDDYLKVRKKKGKVNIHANISIISIRRCLMRLLKARLGYTGYLFSWDNVPEKVNGELLRFLRDDLNIGWVDGAEIRKPDNDRTISIFTGEESAKITIDEENKKATLKISNVRTHDLNVRKEKEEELNIYRDRKDNRVKTTWFNAWAYGRGEPIGLALLQQILIELQKEKGSKEKITELGNSIGKLLIDAVLRKTTGIPYKEAKDFFESSIKIKSTLRDDFENAIAECLQEQDRRFVVFIDDLDRCLPEKTIEILEVIKLFLDVPKCIFVIGVEKDVIQKGIAARYKTARYKSEEEAPISGKDYIEKIIQVPFVLPPIRDDVMTKFVGGLELGKEEGGYVDIIVKGTGCNPRKVKTFLNTLRIRRAIAKRTGRKIESDLSANLLVFEYGFENFYKDVIKYKDEHLLHRLERLARDMVDEEEMEKELKLKYPSMKKYYEEGDLKSLLRKSPYFNVYLFSWDKVPEKVNKELIKSFGHDLDIGWADGAEISKSDDGKTISIVKDEESAKITIDEENKKATLLINDVSTHDLKAIWKNGELKIYNEIDIEPYIYLSTTETLESEEGPRLAEYEPLGPILDELLSGDSVKMNGAADAIKKMPDSEKGKILDDVIAKLEKGENAIVRRNAAAALGSIGDPGAVGALKMALKDDDDIVVRRNAAAALGSIGDPGAVGALIEALGDGAVDVRSNAASALGSIGDPGAVGALIEALKGGEVGVRSNAAAALGSIGDPGAVGALKVALKDDDVAVRKNAAAALGSIGDPGAVGALIEALKGGEVGVRSNAASALGSIGDPGAVGALKMALKDDDVAVRRNAAAALGSIGGPGAVGALIEALKDADEVLYETAVSALGLIGPKAVDALIEALKDEDVVMRRTAVSALGHIGGPRAVEALEWTLKDEDVFMRRDVVSALESIGDPGAVEALEWTLRFSGKEKYRVVRGDAAEALGRICDPIRDPGAVNALEVASRSMDEGVSSAAKKALEDIEAKQK